MIVSVTPAFQEEATIGDVIKETKNFVDITIVVDDCSTDNTWIEAVKAKTDILIRHQQNQGQGYSLRTGVKFALNFKPDVIVTVDADKQHDPSKIPELVKLILNDNFDVVLGSRMSDESANNMPFIKRFGNTGLNIITRVLFGIHTTDSQCGFRAYSPHAAQQIKFLVHRYGWASIMFAEMSEKHLHYKEIPIECIYHNPKKGTTVLDGLWIGAQMVNYKRMHLQNRLIKKFKEG